MFTGLVQAVGVLLKRRPIPGGERFSIRHPFGELALGESIAVAGTCLTVVDNQPEGAEHVFEVELSGETLDCTTFGASQLGRRLNLERAMRADERLGGHLVTGHVDGVGEVSGLDPEGEMTRVSFRLPLALAKYVAQKGSISVDGVSLTINSVTRDGFALLLIPHTQAVTTLGELTVGQKVHLEVDLIARYVERLYALREEA